MPILLVVLFVTKSMAPGDSGWQPSFIAHRNLRDSQLEMIEDGVTAMKNGGFHLAAAPTGIGKTAAALASSLEIAKSRDDHTTVMFLTGRQSQHKIVVETVRKINTKQGAGDGKIGLVDMIGQQGMCINEIRNENRALFSRLCVEKRRSRGCKPWLSNSRSVKLDILQDPLHVEELVARCSEPSEDRPNGICPWKAARETAGVADVIVCDYNHVFVDHVREVSLPAMGLDLSNILLIVDEAHNLPDRIRKGCERTIRENAVVRAKSDLQEHLGNLQNDAGQEGDEVGLIEQIGGLMKCEITLERLQNGLSDFLQRLEADLDLEERDDHLVSIEKFIEIVENSGRGIGEELFSIEELIETLESVRVEVDVEDDGLEEESDAHRFATFLRICISGVGNPAYALVHDKVGDQSRLTTHLLDPGPVCGDIFESALGGILMSGTLNPPEMYSELLRIPNKDSIIMKEYDSPFIEDRRPVLVATDVTSKYSERSKENTEKIRNHISAILKETKGHVALFAPSYAILEEILDPKMGDWWIGRRVEKESPRDSKATIGRTLEMLHKWRHENEPILLAGVMRGKYAEGVDYPGNILDAVICVGLPLPPPSARQDALIEYFRTRYGRVKAWKYASSQPAVNSIMQAMGRSIRKADDRALVVVLEKRLRDRGYRTCMPSKVHVFEVNDAERTGSLARRFYRRHPEPARSFE